MSAHGQSTRPVVLLVAKAPVPGQAKTRLAPAVGERGAAELAQAAFLDTLDACVSAALGRAEVVVALTGDVTQAVDPQPLIGALSMVRVIEQRGADFGARLSNAHHDAAGSRPVLQLGMDTPQVSDALLTRMLDRLALLGPSEAALGRACDGGWWAVALPDAAYAEALRTVPMSQVDTGDQTRKALQSLGLGVRELPELRDVDTVQDVMAVRPECAGRFAVVAERLMAVHA